MIDISVTIKHISFLYRKEPLYGYPEKNPTVRK